MASSADVEASLELMFEPGPMGIRADTNGVVMEVFNGKQGDKNGVEVGMRIVTIDGKPFSQTPEEERLPMPSYSWPYLVHLKKNICRDCLLNRIIENMDDTVPETKGGKDFVLTASIKQVGGRLRVDFASLSGDYLTDLHGPVSLILDQDATMSELESETRARVAYSTVTYPNLVKFAFLDDAGRCWDGDVAGMVTLENFKALILKITVDEGCKVNAADRYHRAPLHKAAEGGHVAGAKLLMKKGANTDATDARGRTPLHFAAFAGHVAVAEQLLQKNATMDGTTDVGRTPLHEAADEGHVAMVGLLLKEGSRKDATTRYGQTPLHKAAKQGHVAVAQVFVKEGANKDATDVRGRTPLHFAAEGGHVAVAELLVGEGAEKYATDATGRTPLHCATGSSPGHMAVAQALFALFGPLRKQLRTKLHGSMDAARSIIVGLPAEK